ncbi:slowpoke-binding protein-like [Oculina patagonica]
MSSFVDYMSHNIWVPVLIAVGIAFIILIIIWLICRRRGQRRYDQIILDEERSLIQKWDDEKKMQKMAERDAVLLNCYYYLKDSKKYSFIDHLPDIGSRINKQWFLVRDSKQEIDAVLTMVPWSSQCVISFSKGTRKTLKELFSLLQHPYLLPVMEVDFVFEHNLVMFVHPFRSAGSLKDVIYGSRSQSSWEDKYQVKGKSLSLTQIRNYGRQVLEALLYLREKGLPACGHLHSGNIFIINGTSKLSGFENRLFGWKSRLFPTVKKLTKGNEDDIEVIQFGHLLYEMLAGWELTTAEPKREQLANFRNVPVVEVINVIFFNESGTYPTLDELVAHPFFRGGDISGLKKFNPGPVRFSSNVKQLLKLYRTEGEEGQRKRKMSTKKSKSDDGKDVTRERSQSKSKGKRMSVDKAALPAVQFHPLASSPPKSPPPLPKVAPPPPRPKRLSVSEKVPPKPPSSAGRGALLSQIQKGTRLKATKTNDKSAPRV